MIVYPCRISRLIINAQLAFLTCEKMCTMQVYNQCEFCQCSMPIDNKKNNHVDHKKITMLITNPGEDDKQRQDKFHAQV